MSLWWTRERCCDIATDNRVQLCRRIIRFMITGEILRVSMRILRVTQKTYPDVKGGAPYHTHAMSRLLF